MLWGYSKFSTCLRRWPLRSWWDIIQTTGPSFGYHANGAKSWLVTKEQYLLHAKELFRDTAVNITSQGRPYLGAALSSDEFYDKFVAAELQDELSSLLKWPPRNHRLPTQSLSMGLSTSLPMSRGPCRTKPTCYHPLKTPSELS